MAYVPRLARARRTRRITSAAGRRASAATTPCPSHARVRATPQPRRRAVRPRARAFDEIADRPRGSAGRATTVACACEAQRRAARQVSSPTRPASAANIAERCRLAIRVDRRDRAPPRTRATSRPPSRLRPGRRRCRDVAAGRRGASRMPTTALGADSGGGRSASSSRAAALPQHQRRPDPRRVEQVRRRASRCLREGSRPPTQPTPPASTRRVRVVSASRRLSGRSGPRDVAGHSRVAWRWPMRARPRACRRRGCPPCRRGPSTICSSA